MRYDLSPLRPGMTAIAAVFALSSTPLLAQATDAAPAAAPAAPVVSAAPPATEAAPAAAPATVPVTGNGISSVTIPKITLDAEPIESTATAAPAEQPATQTRRTSAAPMSVARETRKPVIAAETPVATAPVVAASEAVPVPAAIATPAPVEPAPAPAPVVQNEGEDILPIAGFAGLGALALAGGAYALSRRKRYIDRADDPDMIDVDHVAPEPVAVTPAPSRVDIIPAFAAAAAAKRPVPASTGETATRLPEGFDLSRFGRHTQAAYRGPTPENPSMSLKNRLKRASFYDQREREAAERGMSPVQATAPSPVAAPVERTPARVQKPAVARQNYQWTNFRPAYQN